MLLTRRGIENMPQCLYLQDGEIGKALPELHSASVISNISALVGDSKPFLVAMELRFVWFLGGSNALMSRDELTAHFPELV